MKTTFERHNEKQIPAFQSIHSRNDRHDHEALKAATVTDQWAATCATAGAAVWAGLAVLVRMGIARFGAIELLFLFAPLVIVPLGLQLGRGIGGGRRLQEIAQRLQPAGALLAVVSMWLAPGRKAGLVAAGWLLICVLVAADGFADLVREFWSGGDAGRISSRQARAIRVLLSIARLDLAVGGAWLVASRSGMRPMGTQEPIGLLTAVHFHFAGFATAMIAAGMLRFAGKRRHDAWLGGLALVVAGLPFVVAAGFVVSPVVKMIAAVMFSVSVAGLATVLRACGRKAENPTARILLQVSAGAVFAGMVLAGAYAVGDFLGSDRLTIPQMARTHGIVNAVGFCLPGLLGWLVEQGSAAKAGNISG